MAEQQIDALTDEIARRSAAGWLVVWRGPNEAQMLRAKHFSFWWFLAWTLLSAGTLFWIYPVWHWSKQDELIFVRSGYGWQVQSEEQPEPAGDTWVRGLSYAAGMAIVVGLVAVIVTSAVLITLRQTDDSATTSVTARSTATLASAVAGVEATPRQPTPTPALPEQRDFGRIASLVPGAVAKAEGVAVTIDQIVDPWSSTGQPPLQTPEPGKRFVAVQVTIDYQRGSGQHLACAPNFRLADAAGFAYDPTRILGLLPYLQCIQLGGHQKTQGWIGFEVNVSEPLRLLKYDPDVLTTDDIEFRAE